MEIWHAQMSAVQAVVGNGPPIAACGITNQRETTVMWDRRTGEPVAPAIVWQCRRTADMCAELARSPHAAADRKKDRPRDRRLLLRQQDSLDSRKRAGREGESARRRNSFRQHRHLARSGILPKATAHVTDSTNASRTMLMDLESGSWDDELLGIFDIPRAVLPQIVPSSGRVGVIRSLRRGFRSAASPAISRRRWRVRRAFAPGFRRILTERDASPSRTPAADRPHSRHRLLGTRAACRRPHAAIRRGRQRVYRGRGDPMAAR